MKTASITRTALTAVVVLGLCGYAFAGQIIYVDDDADGANDGSSWDDAYNCLQDALSAVGRCGEIRVAQGTYKPDLGAGITPGDRTATFKLKNGVTLTGGYAGFGEPDPNARDINLYKTILSGDLSGNDVEVAEPCDLLTEPTRTENSYHVVTCINTEEIVVLDGFTVNAGNANEKNSNDPLAKGGGMYYADNLKLANCTFTRNSAREGGGMFNGKSNPTLTNCTFNGNSADGAGGGMFTGGSPALTDCTFTRNSATDGAGIGSDFYSNPIMTNCTFNNNSSTSSGGGVHCQYWSSPKLINCTISENESSSGGGVYFNKDSYPILINCAITKNSAEWGGGGLSTNESCNPTLLNCIIAGNSAGAGAGGGGLFCDYDGVLILTNCIISGNSSAQLGGGLYSFGGTTPILTNCTFHGNYAGSYGGGICCEDSGEASITNCIFWGNDSDRGPEIALKRESLFYPAILTVTYSDISGGQANLYAEPGYNLIWSQGNIDLAPFFADPGYWDANGVWVQGDYHLLVGSPCINAGDPNYVPEPNEIDLDGNPRIVNGTVDMGAYEYQGPFKQCYYVDGINGDDNNDGLSPDTAFATIQKGIDSAQNGDLVIVLPATYTGSGNRDIDFKGKAITVRGENGPNNCIVDCEAQGRGFYFYTGENADSVLEGLTIMNGSIQNMGAGIFCVGTSPSIRNCIIRNCSILGTGAGGGISCDGGGPAIINCTIIDNTGLEGGGIYLLNCDATINSCTISRNGNFYSLGGGLHCEYSSPTVTGCTVTENNGYNGGGGMYCKISSPTITDCTITENYGGNGGGGMYCEYSSLSITDCNFVRNEADYGGGGGIMCTDSNVAISRCTFRENGTDADYSDGGGAVNLVRTVGTIADSSFIDNETIGGSGAGILCTDQSSPVISNCSFVSHRDDVVTCSEGSDPIIRDCSFTENRGIPIDISGSAPTVTNCEIVDNYMMGFEIGGICSPLIVNCKITDNDWGGVWVRGGSPTIVNCAIADNRKYAGIYCQGGHVSVHNSILWKNTLLTGEPNSILLEGEATATVTHSDVQGGWPGAGNIVADPWFIDPDGSNYRLTPISQCINAGDNSAVPPSVLTDLDGNPRIVNGTVDMGAYEFQGIQILYVDDDAAQFGNGTSWATAFNYLQDALFNAVPPAEIRVAQGIYKPHLNTYSAAPPSRTDTFQLKNGVTIKGGYAGLGEPDPDARDINLYKTILSGDMNGDDEPNFVNNGDNSYRVVTGSGTIKTAVLDGFIVTAGNANFEDFSECNGAGMYNDHGSPTVMNCTFLANYAGNDDGGGRGGGMYNDNNSSPTITNCRFIGNCAIALDGGEGDGGGICNWDSNSNLTDCTFIGNTSGEDGGGMWNMYSELVLVNCTFTGNLAREGGSGSCGGGMYNYGCNLVLDNCIFSGNTARSSKIGSWGGGMHNDTSSDVTATNCMFSGNSAQSGGGMSNVMNSRTMLANCAFIENVAVDGGAMYNQGSDPFLNYCVFKSNSGNNGAGICCSNSSPVITNCKFVENSAVAVGGGIYNLAPLSRPNIKNCIFIGNFANYGGGVFIQCNSAPTLTNCTFAGNYSVLTGGGIYCGLGCPPPSGTTIPIITGCILYGNTPDEIYLDQKTPTPVITYSDIQGGWPGEGNIDADPYFVERGYWDANGTPADANDDFWVDGDCHLSLDSPCIDTGDPDYVAEPNETDLDGKPRVIGGRIDMGAYEFWGPIYVDDDAPNDPGPGDPGVGDPLEYGTETHPFDTIQEAVNMAIEGYTVLVRQGSYFELGTSKCIDFLGKNITLTSEDPTDWDIVDNTIVRGYVQFSGPEGPSCKFTGFRISSIEGAIYGGNHTHATISHCNISGNGPCGATVIRNCDGIISNCLITDNTTFFRCGVFPVIFGCNGLIKNCTIANNESGLFVDTATIENCIIYNNRGSQLAVTNGNKVDISYSNVQNGLAGVIVVGDGHVNWGPGNIDTDPCFVLLGYWIMDEMTLIEGDYHLGSEGWRWNTDSKSWTYDYITSRCIDAGNPGSPLRGELMSVPRDPDNVWGINLRINMGAFGGTSQASMPPHDWALLADLNNDGTANFVDFAYQAQDWLITAPEQPGDLNRDGVLNTMDLALLAEEWLKMTVWAE
jgi:hypothetical protein